MAAELLNDEGANSKIKPSEVSPRLQPIAAKLQHQSGSLNSSLHSERDRPDEILDRDQKTQADTERSKAVNSGMASESVATVRPLELLPPAESSDATKSSTGASVLSDWQWTVRLVKHGYRLGEIALIRGKSPDGILADLTVALQLNEEFSIQALFDARTYLTIQELAASKTLPDRPPTLLLVFSGLWDFVFEWLKNHRTVE